MQFPIKQSIELDFDYFFSTGKYFEKDKDDKNKANKAMDAKEKEKASKDAQLTAMLLLVTFVLLGLTLPQYVRYMLAVFIDYHISPWSYSNFILLVQISNKLYFTNNGINFFLYCIGGSKFRHDLKMLCCRRRKGPNGKMSSSISDSTVMSNIAEKQ